MNLELSFNWLKTKKKHFNSINVCYIICYINCCIKPLAKYFRKINDLFHKILEIVVKHAFNPLIFVLRYKLIFKSAIDKCFITWYYYYWKTLWLLNIKIYDNYSQIILIFYFGKLEFFSFLSIFGTISAFTLILRKYSKIID